MSRPEIVTKEQLTAPATEQSGGMQRGQAFAHEGVWCGYADFPGHANTGWHHHGDYATYAYITEGEMTVEFGPDGRESVVARAGDSVYIPGNLVHRETVAPQGGAGFVVRTGGDGPTVHNVDGPDIGVRALGGVSRGAGSAREPVERAKPSPDPRDE